MQPLELIRFRPLETKKDYDRAREIIEGNKFWCSKFYDLNDPMEGVYRISDYENVDSVLDNKNKYVMCSFTDIQTLKEPLLWGYYANGFRGFAIKIRINCIQSPNNKYNLGENKCIKKMKYVDRPEFSTNKYKDKEPKEVA